MRTSVTLPASRPVFLIDGGQESFYVRAGPGTRKLTMSQMLAYVFEKDGCESSPSVDGA
jgi:hypothetical protein